MIVVHSGRRDAVVEGGVTRRVRGSLAGEPGWMSSHGNLHRVGPGSRMSMVWKRSIGTLLGVGESSDFVDQIVYYFMPCMPLVFTGHVCTLAVRCDGPASDLDALTPTDEVQLMTS